MWLRTTCNLEFQMDDFTALILMLRPRSGMQQWVAREAYTPSWVGCDSAMIRYIESRAWLGKTESQGNSIVASSDPGVSH